LIISADIRNSIEKDIYVLTLKSFEVAGAHAVVQGLHKVQN